MLVLFTLSLLFALPLVLLTFSLLFAFSLLALAFMAFPFTLAAFTSLTAFRPFTSLASFTKRWPYSFAPVWWPYPHCWFRCWLLGH